MRKLGKLKDEMHLEKVFNVGGKRVKIWVGGEGLSQYMNELAMTGKYRVFGVSRSQVIELPHGFGVWLLPDEHGFSTHYWIEGKISKTELAKLVSRLEKELLR